MFKLTYEGELVADAVIESVYKVDDQGSGFWKL